MITCVIQNFIKYKVLARKNKQNLSTDFNFYLIFKNILSKNMNKIGNPTIMENEVDENE